MFSQYNQYKLQINFVDATYTSLVQINLWTEDIGHLSVTQKIGFKLNEDFNDIGLNLDIIKKNFKLHVRQMQRIGRTGNTQTITTFNVSIIQNKIDLDFNYTHMRRDQQCMTAVRNGAISHKCYGGYGYGKIKVDYVFYDEQSEQNKKKISSYNPKVNQTRCSFDGFRGSGWDWKWTWAYGAGFSKPQFYAKNHTIQKQRWIGFNFGSLYNKSQDFLFLNGKIYPMQGVKYVIDESFKQKKNITFTATKPQINMVLTVKSKTVQYEDLGMFKSDIVKGEGFWVGYLIDPQDKDNKISFYQMGGLIESVHLLF